jgi:tetratricopeptide (TPR) repeat protein
MMRPSQAFRVTIVVIFAACCYLTAAFNNYSLDDVLIVENNPNVRTLVHWTALFHQNYWLPFMKMGLYRPLTILSFAVQWAVLPNNAVLYHSTNIALHCLTALLVYFLGRRYLTANGALTAAAWFATVPAQVEVVAGLVGLSDILAALFTLAALLCAAKSFEPREARLETAVGNSQRQGAGRAGILAQGYGRWIWSALAALCIFAGMLAKESAIVGAGLIVLMFVFPPVRWVGAAERSRRLQQLLKEPAVWMSAAASVAYLWVRYEVVGLMVTKPSIVSNPEAYFGTATRVRTALVVAVESFFGLIWPVGLSPDYSYNQIPVRRSWLDWGVWAAIGIIAFAFWAVYRRRREPAVVFGALFAALAYLPVSNLLFAIGTIRATRLLYLPSIGVALLAGFAAERILALLRDGAYAWRRGLIAATTAATILVAGAYMYLDLHESWLWSDDLPLFQAAESRAPNSAVVHYIVGHEFADRGRIREAIPELKRAISIAPEFPEAWVSYGSALASENHTGEALAAFDEGLRLTPDSLLALLNKGLLLKRMGKPTEALACFQRAFELSPDNLTFKPLAELQLATQDFQSVVAESKRLQEPLSPYCLTLLQRAEAGPKLQIGALSGRGPGGFRKTSLAVGR